MISFHQTPETFFVEEILFYEPSGEGRFVFAQIEKRGLSTFRAKRQIAETTGVPVDEIRHAGMKDTAATARQYLSWAHDLQRAEPSGGDGVDILSVTRHTNNLSIGHVRANRFRLRLWAEAGDAFPDGLDRHFPNFYGPQRFGRTVLDRTALRGRVTKPAKRREVLSVLQSWLFNDYFRDRLARHDRQVLDDDLWTATNGKTWFVPEPNDPELDERFARGEISPTGPMFGYKVALSEPERSWLLSETDLSPEAFRAWGKVARGARRPLWIKPIDLELDRGEDFCDLSFTLPSGAYATVFLTARFLPEALRGDARAWPDFTSEVVLSREETR